MKVILATNHTYPPQRGGGAESSLHDLALTLKDHGVDVTVLCRLSWRMCLPDVRHPFRILPWLGRQVVADRRFGYPVIRAREPLDVIPDVSRKYEPDVALVQISRPMRLAEGFLASGVPAVVYVRDCVFDLLGTVRTDAGIRYVANSMFIARRFEDTFGIVPECVPPLIRPERYKIDSRRRNVTFVCPVASKGVDIALAIARSRPDIPFVFQESWPLTPELWRSLRNEVSDLTNVTLRPMVWDMRRVYGDARVVLVPSRCEEAWGRVVTEAQISGIPVLASNRAGLRESVGAGGILVDPDGPVDAWVRALSRMWDDPAEYGRLADDARKNASRPDLQPDDIVRRLIRIFEAAAQARPAGLMLPSV